MFLIRFTFVFKEWCKSSDNLWEIGVKKSRKHLFYGKKVRKSNVKAAAANHSQLPRRGSLIPKAWEFDSQGVGGLLPRRGSLIPKAIVKRVKESKKVKRVGAEFVLFVQSV